MHKGSEDAHRDVQDMSNHHDEDEPYPVDTAIAKCLNTDGIERLAKLSACQSESVQTQVT